MEPERSRKSSFLTFIEGSSIPSWDNPGVLAYWPDVQYKTYPRLPKIPLPAPEKKLGASLGFVLEHRTSSTSFQMGEISLVELSTLLWASLGFQQLQGDIARDREHRVYPSAGARYPIEAYIVLKRCRDFSPGLYHYSVPEHALELLVEKDVEPQLALALNDKRVHEMAGALILTACYGRTVEKYGERGYRYCLIEIGHIAQNIYLASTALGLQCCSVGGFVDDSLQEMLDLDKETERALCIVLIGGK